MTRAVTLLDTTFVEIFLCDSLIFQNFCQIFANVPKYLPPNLFAIDWNWQSVITEIFTNFNLVQVPELQISILVIFMKVTIYIGRN